jgi:hypothetical protein
VAPNGRLMTVLAFAITGEKIAEIEVFRDPARFHELELAFLEG